MARLPIYIYPDPVLKKKSEPVKEVTKEIQNLLDSMTETMYAAPGVGLSGPQVGVLKRVVVIDVVYGREEKTAKKLYQLVNPEILEREGEIEWEEGCLSIPGIREEVSRKPTIVIEYYNEKFELIEETIDGIGARIIQHEYDHLEATLFTDKINPLKKRLTKGKLNDIAKGNIKVNYRMKFPLVKAKH